MFYPVIKLTRVMLRDIIICILLDDACLLEPLHNSMA